MDTNHTNEIEHLTRELNNWKMAAFFLGFLLILGVGDKSTSDHEDRPDCEPTAYVIC